MDFALLDNLVYSHSAPSNNAASQSDADVSTLRLYGSAFLSRECADAEPAAKLAKISPRGGDTPKLSLTHHHAPPPPFLRSSSGYGYGVRGPFTPSQWMELEHQALIYKYITANVPIPSYLLNPIMKALQHSGFNCFSLLRPNALGWAGFDKGDPEPGRCRRTDGKKWRCSREAVTDQKYCERHINRGRHRSRKPVEGGPAASNHTSTKRCISPTTIKEAPKMSLEDNSGDTSELSMGLGIGAVASEQSQRHNSWGGGPLGEALHTTTSNNTSQCKALNLIPASTLGVLGGAFAGTG